MIISAPIEPESGSNALRTRRRLRRIALLVGGGAAGVVVGVALSAAFARAADASPLPVPGVQSTPLPSVGPTVPSLIDPVPATAAALPAVVSHAAKPVTSSVVGPPVALPSLATSVTNVAGPASTIPTADVGSPSSGHASGAVAPPSPVPTGPTPGPSTVTGNPVTHTSRPAPGPLPVHGLPTPLPPSSADASAEYATPSPGAGSSGSLPPASLLVPALVLGALLLARESKPLLVYDLRYSPPG